MATITLTNGPDDYTDPAGQANTILGLDGDDIIRALDGNDRLDGGAGADMLFGGTGNDVYTVDDLGDRVIEARGEGTDGVRSDVDFALPAEVENLTLTGSDDIRGLGNRLSNVILGNSGDNVLSTGRRGADVLEGGAGDDVYVIKNGGNNSLFEDVNAGTDTVRTTTGLALPAGFENLFLTAHEAEDGNGNVLNNLIVGNAFANIIRGGGGNDVLKGEGGDDILTSGANRDLLFGGAGADTFEFLFVSDSRPGADARDVIKDYQDGIDQFDLTLLESTSHQSLHFVGSAAFSGDAGELHAVALHGNTLVEADIDGDGGADFQVLLKGAHSLSGDDFLI